MPFISVFDKSGEYIIEDKVSPASERAKLEGFGFKKLEDGSYSHPAGNTYRISDNPTAPNRKLSLRSR